MELVEGELLMGGADGAEHRLRGRTGACPPSGRQRPHRRRRRAAAAAAALAVLAKRVSAGSD